MARLWICLIFISYILVFISGKGVRIAGGDPTEISHYPFATSLQTNAGDGTSFQHACGGTILTSSAIMSAASCFFTNGNLDPASSWRARIGSSFSNSGGLVYLVRLITPHPDFSTATLDNDLAVLRTTFAMQLEPGVAELAFIASATFSLSTNQPIWAIGWGATSQANPAFSEQLRYVQFFVIDQTICATRYSGQGFAVTSNMICAGWHDVGVRGQCLGDNGSPLVIEGVVVGVHSWSQVCGGDGWYPNINTRIGLYTRWIVETATAPSS